MHSVTRTLRTTVAIASAFFVSTASASLPPEDTTPAEWSKVRLEKYQLEKKTLGVQGYDPVAYFPEGDPKGKGAASKGKKSITHTHLGVAYRFSSESNRDLFKKNPAKYEPAYGGWCAYAASYQSYTEPDPKNFKVQNGRLMLFYKSLFDNTRTSWDSEGPALLEPKADAWWTGETGERPPKTERAQP